ncbi:MAG: AbrB/MazE/SpoVT family DNA-binding domain-containing protein [Alicyclobacillus sp.]|nr:AbrB/MazE/SpoVT family DNA-binding domain-containing protein [Alicyclobacillus sp.]
MRSTGVVRKLDELCRIVLPMELRRCIPHNKSAEYHNAKMQSRCGACEPLWGH